MAKKETAGNTRLDGNTYARMLRGAAARLRAHAAAIDDLDAFPEPDGDTGANMTRTAEGGSLVAKEDGSPLGTVAEMIARGMLLSAEGVSGVILAQFFAGIAEGLSGLRDAGAAELAAAFRTGVRRAYGAVMTPAEGTVLTVAREGVEYAASRLTQDSAPEDFFRDLLDETDRSLRRLPAILPILRETGTVDSGGAGLLCLLKAMAEVLESGQAPGGNSGVFPGYRLAFRLLLPPDGTESADQTLRTLTDQLGNVGDSVVAFTEGAVVNVHMNTNTPGEVLSLCLRYGEMLNVKAENAARRTGDALAKPAVRRPFCTVAAASGEGLRQVFRDLGADAVVEGGLTGSLSSEQLMRTFDGLNAMASAVIFVLPDSEAALSAARQAAARYRGSEVRVVGSRTPGDVYAALSMLSYDSGDADETVAAMESAMRGVVTAFVRSVEGDFVGHCGCEAQVRAPDLVSAAAELLERIGLREHTALTVIRGTAVPPGACEALRAQTRARYPETQWQEIAGGQTDSDLILVAE